MKLVLVTTAVEAEAVDVVAVDMEVDVVAEATDAEVVDTGEVVEVADMEV